MHRGATGEIQKVVGFLRFQQVDNYEGEAREITPYISGVLEAKKNRR